MSRPTLQSNHAVPIHRISVKSFALLCVSILILLFCCKSSHAAAGQTVQGNVPHFASSATVLGREDSDKVIEISVWLQIHNQADLDALAKDLYNPNSPSYRHWLTPEELASRFAPTLAEAKTVQSYLESKGFKLVRMDPKNFYVRVSGTVRNVEAAFHVSLNQYQLGTKVVRANDSEPSIDEEVAPLIRHISGLDSVELGSSTVSQSAAPEGIRPHVPKAVSAANTSTSFFTSDCFTGFRVANFTTNGTYPRAFYHGNNYTSSEVGCGYTPTEIQSAYGLNSLYQRGFDGTGQTIVIVVYCGSPTITDDANAFSAMFGLPPLTAANFKILQSAPSTCAQSFNPNVNSPVEWAHAIAPGANIDLVEAPDTGVQDIDQAILYAVNNHLGSVINGTYGTPEQFLSASELATENQILEMAAVSGIAANFPTGDQGDGNDGISTNSPTVQAPASSPFATAVGGISLALNPDNSIAWQTGWGAHEGSLRVGGVLGFPVASAEILGGSGGGSSETYAKPPFQHALAGKLRLVPDVSWVADFNTPGVIAISHPGQFPPIEYVTTGGTEMAVAMFSGLWAIANQAAKTPLGQAAPYLYAGYDAALPAGSVTDIVPYSNSTNVTGEFQASATSTTLYKSWTLAGVPEGTAFYSAFYDFPGVEDTTFLLVFGLDTTLTITKGWDNVTGEGVPNPVAMVNNIIEKFK
jgi:subtilase family serine protease